MRISQTSKALDWLMVNPDSNPHAAAVKHGITPGCLYAAIKRIKARNFCPCCGQVIKGMKS